MFNTLIKSEESQFEAEKDPSIDYTTNVTEMPTNGSNNKLFKVTLLTKTFSCGHFFMSNLNKAQQLFQQGENQHFRIEKEIPSCFKDDHKKLLNKAKLLRLAKAEDEKIQTKITIDFVELRLNLKYRILKRTAKGLVNDWKILDEYTRAEDFRPIQLKPKFPTRSLSPKFKRIILKD